MEYLLEQIGVLLVAIALFLAGLFNPSALPTVAPLEAFGTSTAVVTSVIDGDTIDVILEGDTNITRVRYIGINTPEPYAHKTPDCGSEAASMRNSELVKNKTVTLITGIDPWDKYDRLLAYVYVGDTFVNKALIAEGYATIIMIKPNTRYQTEFTNLYTEARKGKLGMWANCSDV